MMNCYDGRRQLFLSETDQIKLNFPAVHWSTIEVNSCERFKSSSNQLIVPDSRDKDIVLTPKRTNHMSGKRENGESEGKPHVCGIKQFPGFSGLILINFVFMTG